MNNTEKIEELIKFGEGQHLEFNSNFNNELIEKYGSGIQRIIKYFSEAQLPAPQFRNISDGFMITFFKGESLKVIEKVTVNQNEKFDVTKYVLKKSGIKIYLS